MPSATPTRHLTRHQILASASRTAVLTVLREADGPVGVGEVADAVGLHPNTVRGHLDLLVDAGFAHSSTEAPQGPGRPRIVYTATTVQDDESNYRLLAEVLARYVSDTATAPATAAAAAGRAWVREGGTHVAPDTDITSDVGRPDDAAVDGLVRMLADAGFSPELTADRDEIHLHHCPFRELALTHPDIACGAHLGIIQGTLAELGAPAGSTRLLPMVQPDLCITSFVPAEAGDSDAPVPATTSDDVHR